MHWALDYLAVSRVSGKVSESYPPGAIGIHGPKPDNWERTENICYVQNAPPLAQDIGVEYGQENVSSTIFWGVGLDSNWKKSHKYCCDY